jgi:hypothetical protein
MTRMVLCGSSCVHPRRSRLVEVIGGIDETRAREEKLPKGWTVGLGWSLGVRCVHCHEGDAVEFSPINGTPTRRLGSRIPRAVRGSLRPGGDQFAYLTH